MDTNCTNCGYPVSSDKTGESRIILSCPRCGHRLPQPIRVGETTESDKPPKEQGPILE